MELAASITANGVVQPILVRRLGGARFQLIAGERRWRASKLAGKTTIPAILRQVSDEQAMEITIVENLQRADLNPMEQARAFERLSREFHMTQEQMAVRTGKDRASVANFLRVRVRARHRASAAFPPRAVRRAGGAACVCFRGSFAGQSSWRVAEELSFKPLPGVHEAMPGEDSLETHWVEHARLDELEQPGFVLGTPLHGIAR